MLERGRKDNEMRNKFKAEVITCMLVGMFYAVLYCITLFYAEAWKWYGIGFGIYKKVKATR